jgi:hypothetical protein
MTTRLCFAFAIPLAIAVFPAQAHATDRWGGIDRWTPVSDTRLAQARGGFDIGNGLMASFGFDRTITINGVTTTIANVQIPDISKMTRDQAQALEAATRASLVQNGPGNAVSAPIVDSSTTGTATGTPAAASAPSTAAAGPTGAPSTGAVASATTSTSLAAPATASAPAPAKATTPASVAAAAIAAPAIAAATQAIGNSATVIQNSLDNQTIQSSTTLSTSVNTLSTFHNINFQAGLQDALIRSR